MESDLYVNGIKVGINRMGYNPFYFDIPNYLKFDGNDILALFVRNKQPAADGTVAVEFIGMFIY